MNAIAAAMSLIAVTAVVMTVAVLWDGDWSRRAPAAKSRSFGPEGLMTAIALTASIVLAVIAG